MNTRELFRHRSIVRLTEWQRFYVNQKLESPDEAVNREGLEYTEITYSNLNELGKRMLDGSDRLGIDELIQEWRAVNGDLLPHYHGSRLEDYPFREVDSLFRRYMLGLCMWSVHIISTGHADTTVSKYAFEKLSDSLLSERELAEAIAAAEADDEPWSRWLSMEKAAYEAHFIETNLELKRAYVLLMLRSRAWEFSRAPLTRDLLLFSKDQMLATVESLEGDASFEKWLSTFFPSSESLTVDATDGLSTVVAFERLKEAIERWAAEAEDQRRAELREATLDESKVAQFVSAVRKHSLENRLFFDLTSFFGAEAQRRPSEDAESYLGLREWLPKDLFVANTNMVGIEQMARDLAQAVVRSDKAQFLERASELTVEPAGDVEPIQRSVEARIAQLSDQGFTPSVVFIPLSWKLNEQLTGQAFWRNAASDEQNAFPPNHLEKIGGFVGGVPVVSVANMERPAIVVADIGKWLRLSLTSPVDELREVEFALREFRAEAAFEFVDANPSMTEDGKSPTEVALTIQERVLGILKIWWAYEVLDMSAAIAIEAPSEYLT